MKESFIHSTENHNLYLYDVQRCLSLLIHPELKKAHEESADADFYYSEKYAYLKKHGLFEEAHPIDFGTEIDESTIKRNIAQARQIVFETTDHCNLNCLYCSLGELYTVGKKDRRNINSRYALNLLKYIFDLKPEGSRLMIGFFGGEPLVNFKFIETIVEEAKRLNTGEKLELAFNMTTNATLLHKHIHFLVENNFVLLISLDGDEAGQSYRTFAKDNKNSFQKVIENIDRIKREYPEYFDSENVSFNAVLHNHNSVKSINEFIYGRYNKFPKISQINVSGINPDKKELFERMFHDKRESENEYRKENSDLETITHTRSILFKDLRGFLKNYSINRYISNLLYLLYTKIDPIPTGTCSPFSRKIYFNTYNNLLPCEKLSYKDSLGKVNKESVVIDISEIARKYNSYYKHFAKVCRNCYADRACFVCLFTLDNLDKLGTDEFACPVFLDQDRFKNRLNRIFSFLEKYPSDYSQIIDAEMI